MKSARNELLLLFYLLSLIGGEEALCFDSGKQRESSDVAIWLRIALRASFWDSGTRSFLKERRPRHSSRQTDSNDWCRGNHFMQTYQRIKPLSVICRASRGQSLAIAKKQRNQSCLFSGVKFTECLENVCVTMLLPTVFCFARTVCRPCSSHLGKRLPLNSFVGDVRNHRR